jgi:hypothetical protein
VAACHTPRRHPGNPLQIAHLSSLLHRRGRRGKKHRTMACDCSGCLPPGNQGQARNGLESLGQRVIESAATLSQLILVDLKADGNPTLKNLSLSPTMWALSTECQREWSTNFGHPVQSVPTAFRNVTDQFLRSFSRPKITVRGPQSHANPSQLGVLQQHPHLLTL